MRQKDDTSVQKQLDEQADEEKTLQLAYTEINHIFNISFPICFIDKNYNMIHVNDTFCSFFKIPREEILGRKCYEIKRHQFCGTQNCTFAQLSNGTENCEFETEFEIDNERKSCIISARPYRGPEGEVLGIVENLIDITARRKAEEDLRKLEEEHRLLLENAQEGIWAIDNNAYTTYVNQRMSDILGYTRDEMLGQHLFSFMDERGIELAKVLLKRREEGIREQHDFEFLRKDGNRIYTSLETGPIYDKDGNYNGAVAIITDVTEQRRAEKELRNSEEKFRSLFNNAHDSITITDLEGHFLEVNTAAIDRLGYSREEYLEMSINDIVPSDYLASVSQRIIELTKRGHTTFETAHKRRDGAIIPIEMSTQIIDYTGQKAILGIARDITERKRLENIQNQVIAITSHELRTPISALSQSISNLKKYYEKLTESQKRRLIESISRNTEILTELTNDLLLISQLNRQELKLEWIPYAPYNLLQDVLNQLEQKRSDRKIEIIIDINQNIQLFGDPKRIGQIFQIFLDNSLKYSAKGTKIQIKATDHYRGEYNTKNSDGLLIQFTDSGRGISPEDIPYIFTPFFRAEEVRSIPGTGLGLTIALDLVQLHQGEIYVESSYGKGTTFFLFLPRLRKSPS